MESSGDGVLTLYHHVEVSMYMYLQHTLTLPGNGKKANICIPVQDLFIRLTEEISDYLLWMLLKDDQTSPFQDANAVLEG